MKTQENFCFFDIVKLKLNFFSATLILSLISSPITKKLFLQLSEYFNDLLSTPKL